MDTFEENPYAYFHYLKVCRGENTMGLLAEIAPITESIIRTQKYYDIMNFKNYLCELVYNGINLFPRIRRYTITCQNEMGESSMVFGAFESMCVDDKEPCMAKFFGKDVAFNISRKDIKDLYSNNRHEYVDNDNINAFIVLLFMGGCVPKVSTKFEIDPNELKNNLTFKC
jgi:hypothetical protein